MMSVVCHQVFLSACFAVAARAAIFQDGDIITLKAATMNKYCREGEGCCPASQIFTCDLAADPFPANTLIGQGGIFIVKDFGDGFWGLQGIWSYVTPGQVLEYCANYGAGQRLRCDVMDNTDPRTKFTFEWAGNNIAIKQGGGYCKTAYPYDCAAVSAADEQFEVCKWDVTNTNMLSMYTSSCEVLQAPPAAVGGDPIITFDGVEKKFTMPLHKLTLLLRTEELSVHVSVFPGEAADEQWIDRVLVTSLEGEVVADINIRKDLKDFDREKEPADALETLTVRAPWLSEPTLSLPANSDALVPVKGLKCCKGLPHQFEHHSNVTFILMRVVADARSSEQKEQLAPRNEALMFFSKSVDFMVSSVSAFEYYYADENDTRALKYAHLDINFFSMYRSHMFKGLLPELWGPDTNHTECAVGGKQALQMNSSTFTRPDTPIEPELQRVILETTLL